MVLIGRLPKPIRRGLGAIAGRLLVWLPNQSKRVTTANLRRAYPSLSECKLRAITRASLIELGHKFFTLLATWKTPAPDVQKWVTSSEGDATFHEAVRQGPTLILLPHLGNWELFGLWLSQPRPYTAMFRPMRLPAMSDIVRLARERGGNRLVPATPTGVKSILRDLKTGSTAIILPDQTPKQGMGEFLPFFGLETLTATLPFRLAQATRARVFVAGAVRDTQGYHVFFEELVAPTQSQTEWLTAMNAVIEAWVRRFPDQYQWEYNRFHQAPDGTHRVI